MKRFTGTTIFLIALAIVGSAVSEAPRRAVNEASVLVAYLYNFGKFVGWPDATFESPQATMHFCLYGDDELGSVADALNGKSAHGHPIQVTRLRRGAPIHQCHVLYVAPSERLYVRPLLDLTRQRPILTVSEIEGFANTGGVIGLVTARNRLKFEINTAAATEAQLRISSQLLKLALNVVEDTPR